MIKYYSRRFPYGNNMDVTIDVWLKSFERDIPNCEGSYCVVQGYVPTDGGVLITVSRWETKS